MASISHDLKYLLGFALLPNFGSVKLRKIKKFFPSFEKAWQSSSAEDFINAGIEEKWVSVIFQNRPLINLDKAWEKLIGQNITIITEDDPVFPLNLKEIKAGPFLLFCRGNLELLQKKQIAIIGTRRPTLYGKQVTEKLTAELGQAGLVITSGLAQGIDCLAHQTALDNNLPTIAVLGNGLSDQMLQRSVNYQLSQEIIHKNGLVISEFPPDYPASKFTFPARNRIISGLSVGVLVIEAGEKSGSLITADYALEQNRDVYAVPGNIFSAQSIGTHLLIKQGALLTSSAKDILTALSFQLPAHPLSDKKIEFTDKTQERIYKHLSYEPIYLDKLAKLTQIDSATLSSTISLMELSGIVKSIGQGRVVKNV